MPAGCAPRPSVPPRPQTGLCRDTPDHGRAASVEPVRIATWNVNSVIARLPRLVDWLGIAEPDVLCLQELKTARVPDRRGVRARLRGGDALDRAVERRWHPVPGRHRVGPRRVARRAGLPARGRDAGSDRAAGSRRHLWRSAALVGVRAERARGRPCALRLQAAVAGRAAGHRRRGTAVPRAVRRRRRLQHRADRRRRMGRQGGARRDPHQRARAGGAGPAARVGAARCRAAGVEARHPVHVLGLPGRHVPQEHGHAHRPRLRVGRAGRRGH